MNKKIGFIVVFTLFIVVTLFNSHLAFAQDENYAIIVDVVCTNLVTDETNGFFSFTVSTQVTGTNNRVTAINMSTAEEHIRNVGLGDTVVVSYSFFYATDLDYSTETGILRYTGPADSVTINAVEIPEFSPTMIITIFMTATLLAIFYSRKRATQT